MSGGVALLEVEQTEKAFQKQSGIFHSSKKALKTKRNKKGNLRYWKSVGLGFKTPKGAVEGSYVDHKCPWTSGVSVRGRILRGVAASLKMKRTVVVRRNYLHYIKKYARYEKRHKNFHVHLSPCLAVSLGDEIIFGETRPLSKTVTFAALQVNAKTNKQNRKFVKF